MRKNYTPGPWKFKKWQSSNGFYIETVDMSHQNTFIGDVGGGLQGENEIQANAHLISAAPELLEALIIARDYIGNIDSERDIVDAAIAKALGPAPT